MEYLGEWIWAAYVGRLLVALAFASALLAMVSFGRGNIALGRKAFVAHSLSTLGVIALIFVLFFGHRYEFQYIWKHLNNEMPMRFVLSAFWGGQEGGFLLWMFWHNVLALFILRRTLHEHLRGMEVAIVGFAVQVNAFASFQSCGFGFLQPHLLDVAFLVLKMKLGQCGVFQGVVFHGEFCHQGAADLVFRSRVRKGCG